MAAHRRSQAAYADRLIETLRPFIPAGAKTLLDIGGSTGVVAARMCQEFGLEAVILDPSVECTTTTPHVKWSRGLLEDMTGAYIREVLGTKAFDVVLMCQTVDHLWNLKAGLQTMRELIAPNGICFVDIVDFRFQYLRTDVLAKVFKIDHPYYLTESRMDEVLSEIGLEWLEKVYERDGAHVGYLCRSVPPLMPAMLDATRLMLVEFRYAEAMRRAQRTRSL